jgi:hypothetical protein
MKICAGVTADVQNNEWMSDCAIVGLAICTRKTSELVEDVDEEKEKKAAVVVMKCVCVGGCVCVWRGGGGRDAYLSNTL